MAFTLAVRGEKTLASTTDDTDYAVTGLDTTFTDGDRLVALVLVREFSGEPDLATPDGWEEMDTAQFNDTRGGKTWLLTSIHSDARDTLDLSFDAECASCYTHIVGFYDSGDGAPVSALVGTSSAGDNDDDIEVEAAPEGSIGHLLCGASFWSGGSAINQSEVSGFTDGTPAANTSSSDRGWAGIQYDIAGSDYAAKVIPTLANCAWHAWSVGLLAGSTPVYVSARSATFSSTDTVPVQLPSSGLAAGDMAMVAITAPSGAMAATVLSPPTGWRTAPRGGRGTAGVGVPRTWVYWRILEDDESDEVTNFTMDGAVDGGWNVIIIRNVHPAFPFSGAHHAPGTASSGASTSIGSTTLSVRIDESLIVALGGTDGSSTPTYAEPKWTNTNFTDRSSLTIGTDNSSWATNWIDGLAAGDLTCGSLDWNGSLSGWAIAYALRSADWAGEEASVAEYGSASSSNSARNIPNWSGTGSSFAQLLAGDVVVIVWADIADVGTAAANPYVSLSEDSSKDFELISTISGAANGDQGSLLIFARRITDADILRASTEVSGTGDTGNYNARIGMVIDGADLDVTLDDEGLVCAGINFTPASTAPNPAALAVAQDGSMAVLAVTQRNAMFTNGTTPPTGYSGLTGQSSDNVIGLGIAWKAVDAGTEDPDAWTTPNDEGVLAGLVVPGQPAGSAPVNTVAPAVTGTETEGETLSCTEGTWDPAGDSYTYQWYEDDGGGHDAIAGETTSTLVLTSDQVDKDIKCTVTATNDIGSVAADSNEVGPIEGLPAAGGSGKKVSASISRYYYRGGRRARR